MNSTAPDVIGRYLTAAADRTHDVLSDCFTDDAFVVDEDHLHRGIAEIQEWRRQTAAAFTYTTTIAKVIERGDDRYRVTAHLVGDFPGGEADLDFDFRLTGDRIAALVITG
ncbi:MAG: hypothetical protein JWL72_331 [Ilumatobacteraceae bacterium]|nr:hypothetical protein [Ilumatobacteraceae bacterium]